MTMEACREEENPMGNLEKIASHQRTCSCYPRPDFARESWESLNGEWEFEFDREKRFQTADQALGAKFKK